MSFQDAFPEHQSVPPTLTGQNPLPYTKLTALRRRQLVDLARAFEIPIPSGATKDEMLPVMIAAEQRGIFRTNPKHPWWLQKADHTSDMPSVYLPPNPDIEQPVVKAEKKKKESDYHRKQRLLKQMGVDTWALPKAEMDRLAEEHGIS